MSKKIKHYLDAFQVFWEITAISLFLLRYLSYMRLQQMD